MLVAEEYYHQHLPPTETLAHVLSKYVDVIHAQLPFLNLEGFSGNVQAAVKRGEMSLFLLFTILAAAFPHADDIFAVMAGWDSPKEAATSYFHVAEAIYQERIEQDPVVLACGFLLLSTCSSSRTTDYYHQKHRCITNANHFARAANAHLDADEREVSQTKNAKLKRRLAWCCFVQERIIAMSATPLTPLLPTEKFVVEARMICNGDFHFRPILTTFYGLRSPLLQDTLAQMCVAYLFKLRAYVCCYLIGQPPPQLHRDKVWQWVEAQIVAWYTSFLDMFRSQAILATVQRCLVIQWESLVLLYQTVKLRSLHDSWSATHSCVNQHISQDALATWECMKKVLVRLDQTNRLCCIPEGAVSFIYPAVLCISKLRHSVNSGVSSASNLDKENSLASLLDTLRKCFGGIDTIVASAVDQLSGIEREYEAQGLLRLPPQQTGRDEIRTKCQDAAGTICPADTDIRQIRARAELTRC